MKLIIHFCPIFYNTFFYSSRHTLYQRLQKLKSFESQIFRILRFHSLINPGSIFSNESLIICHKFSIGFRSGKQGGPSKAPIPRLLSHYFVFAVRSHVVLLEDVPDWIHYSHIRLKIGRQDFIEPPDKGLKKTDAKKFSISTRRTLIVYL